MHARWIDADRLNEKRHRGRDDWNDELEANQLNHILLTGHKNGTASAGKLGQVVVEKQGEQWDDRQWFIVGRWRELEGEQRANLVRVMAIVILFAVQLIHYVFVVDHQGEGAEAAKQFHQAAIALAVAGSMFSFMLLLLVRMRFFPTWLKFVSSGLDVVLVTSAAALGAGPNSPVVLAFFVAIALAGLRFSLPLVWCASLASMAAFVFLVGAKDEVWFDADHVIAPVHQMVMLACLALTGVVVGQSIRQARRTADDYAARLQSKEPAS